MHDLRVPGKELPLSLEALCREMAARIPGAKAFPGGGLVFRRRGFEGRVEFSPGAWDVIFDTHELAVEPLELSPAGLWHDLRDLLGFKDVQLGDPGFDRDFHVRAPSADVAGSLLPPWLRKRLVDILRFGAFRWRLSRAGFLLRMKGAPADAAELDRWMSLAYDLLDALPERVALGEARVKLDGETACGVCGVELSRGALVRCSKCATPHHADCWDFNGRCAIFACGAIIARRG